MKLAGLVLMGGKSTRMGHPKAFLKYQNKEYYQQVLSSLESLHTIYLSVAKKEEYEYLGYPLIIDMYVDIGPIGGIYSALKNSLEEAIFVLPCDVPKISKQLVNHVISYWREVQKPVIVTKQGKIQPLIGIYTKDCVTKIEEQIQKQCYKMITLVDTLDVATISLEQMHIDSQEIDNINSPKDIQRLLQ